MKLTGKCKIDFEKWQKAEDWFWNAEMFDADYTNLELFNELPNSLKYGVYVDYFDSVGIDIDVFNNRSQGFYGYRFTGMRYMKINIKTRQEARTKAIEKANEIYNEKL